MDKYVFPDPVEVNDLENPEPVENPEMVAIANFMKSLQSGSFSLEKEEADETEK